MDSNPPKIGREGLAQAETALSVEAAPSDGWIGRVLDERYRITERLGEGGMGAVFIAEHLKLHKAVALKVIREELAGNGEVATRFAREAMATAQFEHPHVASAIDFGTLPEGGAYFVMQLVRGRSLREVLENGALPWRRACELLSQVADALSAARAVGIVHRDLKPENILIEMREDGSELAKVLDFGIAHVAPRQHARAPEGALPTRELTRIGTVMGTPGYMAPEQAVGDKIDHRADLYALGVVLWECITGRCLWDGEDVTTIIARQMREDVPLLRKAISDPTVPKALDDLVQTLCARQVDLRPAHAGAVRDALRELVAVHSQRSSSISTTLSHAWSHAQQRAAAMPQSTRALWIGASAALLLSLVAWGTGPREPGSTALFPIAKHIPAQAITTIPEELESDVKTMLESSKVAERRKSAQTVLAYAEPKRVFPYVLAIAKLESARGCRDRRDAVREIAQQGDKRCLESLRRLAASSRTGCGFLSLEDCHSCLRQDLRRAIEDLEGDGVSDRATAPDTAP
jgi:serine/threonine protein kinase